MTIYIIHSLNFTANKQHTILRNGVGVHHACITCIHLYSPLWSALVSKGNFATYFTYVGYALIHTISTYNILLTHTYLCLCIYIYTYTVLFRPAVVRQRRNNVHTYYLHTQRKHHEVDYPHTN